MSETTKHTCQIQWIDDDGNPTPDTNPAIGYCWMPARFVHFADGRTVPMDESRHYAICAEHAKQLDDLEMKAEWCFEPISAE